MRKTYKILSSCTACELCLEICPTQSIFLGSPTLVIDTDTCDGSAICAKICPVDAIVPSDVEVADS